MQNLVTYSYCKCLVRSIEYLIIHVFEKHIETTCPRMLIRVKSESTTGGVFRNFAKFTGKYLYQILFFNKVADLSLRLY